MVSRLDRLFILLDTGSNESVRLAAAKQLGEVQRFQPNDLNYLLRRIKEYSSKKVWETRVAAGHAIRCILEHVDPWPSNKPAPLSSKDDNKLRLEEIARNIVEQNAQFSSFIEQFDLDKIISTCPKLFSLDLSDTEYHDLIVSAPAKRKTRGRGGGGGLARRDSEQLMRQRKLINKELGIAMVDSLNIGVKSTDIVSNDDLQDEYSNTDPAVLKSSSTQQQDAKAIIMDSVSNYDKVIAALYRQGCIFNSSLDGSITADSTSSNSSKESGIPKIDSDSWPLSDIVKQFSEDLFNPSWETRHGAAIALREIIKQQGQYAGRRPEMDDTSNRLLNQIWLVDMALRALSVLALDRFGDFLFDQVVAPVRENTAQLLGYCVAHLENETAIKILLLTTKLLENDNWETRHGGILGLKYSLNVFYQILSADVFQECFQKIFKCLSDTIDDVSAEAAATLVPMKDLLVKLIPDEIPRLTKFLWEYLAGLDELSTSTSNIVLLLASLITSKSAQLEPSELRKSIPKLWSLLGHTSSSVRMSVFKALITLLNHQKGTFLSWADSGQFCDLIPNALRLVYQRSVIENLNEVRPLIEEVWRLLIRLDPQDESHSRSLRLNLLGHTSKYLNYWLCLVMQPSNTPIDRSSPMWLHVNADGSESKSKPDGDIYIGSCTFNAESADQQRLQVMECRMLGTRLLGILYANLVNDFSDSEESRHAKESSKYISDMFTHYLKTKSANQRIISGWAIESWANHQTELLSGDVERLGIILSENLINQLTSDLQETSLCYDELASTFTRLQQETRDFVAALRSSKISLDLLSSNDKRAIYNLSQIKQLCELNIEAELTRIASKRPHDDNSQIALSRHDITRNEAYIILSTKKINLTKSLKSTISEQKTLSTSVLSSLACASIAWRLPMPKLDLIANPLLDSVELEEEPTLQDKSIRYLVKLFDILCENSEQNSHVIESFLKRLIDVLSYRELSSIFESEAESHPNNVPNSADAVKKSEVVNYRIILLDNLQRKAELGRSFPRRQSSITSTSGLKRSQSLTSSSLECEASSDLGANPEDTTRASLSNSRSIDGLDVKYRGASLALSSLVEHFAEELPVKLPQFWQSITSEIKSQIHLTRFSPATGENVDKSVAEVKLIKNLRLLEVVGGSLNIKLRKHLLDSFPDLIELLPSGNPLIRHHGAQCIGVISKLAFSGTIEMINKRIIPMLDENDNISARCGSIEAVALIIEHLQLELVPRINMFVIQVLRRMSDQNDQVRLMATHCFGKLLSLMPLNLKANTESDSAISMDSIKTEPTEPILEDQGKFIDQLLNPKKLDHFEIPFTMETELRSYQRDGLHWLAFLNRYNLHGILCDEMGLGKTFMTICMVASNHQKMSMDIERSSSPSLIVCPPTLTQHWLCEIEKFLPPQIKSMLGAIAYTGHIHDRMGLRGQILRKGSVDVRGEQGGANTNRQMSNLVVTSYDMVRNDIEFFKSIHWNYCVLDEGHIIKNGKTKLSKSIRLLTAKHRLILTGTPIQNNVTELWSLFDFLMPGFLGSERQFNCRYAKPIIQSRELKCSPRELEAGVLAMESLHRQVLPFILRRLKEDVLDDLPPKIIQDYYCELSPLQCKLYEDFTRSKLCQDVTKKSVHSLRDQSDSQPEEINQRTGSSSKSHVFQALQYLKNVCNHPKLVLTEKHSQYSEIKKSLDADRSSLDDVAHSSKLKALKQLLIDCGIGVTNQSGDETQSQQQQQQNLDLQSVVNQHRALIFCQIRTLVNIIEEDLLKKHFPTVTYLKLDGSVPTNQRHSIVSRFNNDPSIDLLLLTTSIGGLGLNLTGADTVIFVEHDWNPTKDLQAMDRAHRIGQRKVVNVYRLITKGTLEEKIMGLQKFKTMVSNTVINQDNTGLGTMNVDQLFDLFNDVGDNSRDPRVGATAAGGNKSFVDLLPELWDQQQYETEYDLSNFVSSLKS